MAIASWPFGDLARGHYGVVLADPPWRYRTWSETNQHKSASRHYRLMPTGEIAALPVAGLAARDCVLLLWAINPMLPQAFSVMAAWGFAYKTVAFTWAKTTSRTDGSWAPKWHLGLGFWTRANTELCLLGVRGKPRRLARDVPQLIVEPRREHSRKPDVHARIERLCAGPYAELFARRAHGGAWDSWGDQLDRFAAPDIGAPGAAATSHGASQI